MRVVFINRFYWPSEQATAQLLHDLAVELTRRGHEVVVVTGHSSADLKPEEMHEGVRILRIGGTMSATQNLFRRAVDFVMFHCALIPALRRGLQHGDCAVPLTDPPLVSVTTAAIAGSRGARVLHWVQDIYPEIVRAVHPAAATRLLTGLLRPLRDTSWRRAAGCVVLGDDMATIARQAGVTRDRVHVIANWAPRGVAPAGEEATRELRRQWNLSGRFVVGYSGNLGRVHDLGAMLTVAQNLANDSRFAFLFVGRGADFARLQRDASDRGLANVVFLPPRPRSELSASLAVPDLHLISLREGCEGLVFPSKLYGTAAAGRPVILLGASDSDLAHIIRSQEMGAVFQPSDAAGITAYLRDMVGDPGRCRRQADAAAAFHHANGGIARAAGEWETLLCKFPADATDPDSRRRAPDAR